MIVKNAALAQGRVALRPENPPAVVPRPLQAHDGFPRRHEPEPITYLREPVADEMPTIPQLLGWIAAQSESGREEIARALSREIENVQEKARLEGFDSGHKQALRSFQSEADRTLHLLKTMSAECQTALERELATMGECTIVVLEEVLRKIAGPMLATREAVMGAVLQVVDRLKEEREISIRVAALDLPVLNEMQPQLAEALGNRAFRLAADDRVVVGGCIVDSNMGSLDGRLELQLNELLELIAAEKRALLSQ